MSLECDLIRCESAQLHVETVDGKQLSATAIAINAKIEGEAKGDVLRRVVKRGGGGRVQLYPTLLW